MTTTDTIMTDTYTPDDWALAMAYESLRTPVSNVHVGCEENDRCRLWNAMQEMYGDCLGRGYVPSIDIEGLAEVMAGEGFGYFELHKWTDGIWQGLFWTGDLFRSPKIRGEAPTGVGASTAAAVKALGIGETDEH